MPTKSYTVIEGNTIRTIRNDEYLKDLHRANVKAVGKVNYYVALAKHKLGIKPKKKRPELLGDRVERMLSSVGVTKERYAEAKKLFGLPPTCNCAGRQEWLNDVNRWWRGQTK